MTKKTRNGHVLFTNASSVMIQQCPNTDAPDAQSLSMLDESVFRRERFSLAVVESCALITSRKVETIHYTGQFTPTTALFAMVGESLVSLKDDKI